MIKISLKSSIISLLIIFSAGPISTAGNMTGVENIQTWKHPVKEVFQKHKVKLHKIELLNNKTYPVFYVTFPYDPHVKHNKPYFISLYYDTLKANGFWKYSFISLDDNLKINLKWNKKTKTVEEDVQDIHSASKGLTPAQAIKIVREYPEVKHVIKANPARPVHVEVMENKADQYILRTYTIVPPEEDLPGHTATFGWYSVEKKTEKITSVIP